MRISNLIKKIIVLLCIPLSVFANNPTQIIFWHSLPGQLGQEVKRLTEQFNHSQNRYEIQPVYKGDYIESLTGFAAAFRAKQAPNLIQVFEVGSSVMRYPEGITLPVEKVLRENGVKIEKDQFFPAVVNNYSEANQLIAFPFNVSVPIFFYNADILARYGVAKQNFPRTWDGFELLLKKLHLAGYDCAYTTAYPAWIIIESYSAIHGLKGEAGQSALREHLQRMVRWQKEHYFEYGGHVDEATVLFTSGHCPIFSQSSGAYASLSQMVPFQLGVAPMPLDTNVSKIRHDNVVGGAALWVVNNQTPETLRGIAQFLSFLVKPEIQNKWYKNTGYLPLHHSNLKPKEGETAYAILDIAALDLLRGSYEVSHLKQTAQNQVRIIHDQMLESIFSGIQNTDDAILAAAKRESQVRKRFALNTEEHAKK